MEMKLQNPNRHAQCVVIVVRAKEGKEKRKREGGREKEEKKGERKGPSVAGVHGMLLAGSSWRADPKLGLWMLTKEVIWVVSITSGRNCHKMC